jgi:hypothetical protein
MLLRKAERSDAADSRTSRSFLQSLFREPLIAGVLRGSAMSPTSDAELAEQLAASERRVGELSAKYLPRTLPTTETTRPPKRCPECGESMEPGVVGVRGELWAFLFVGWSYQHCWFRSDDAETKVIRSGRGRRGHRCPKCGYVGISGGKDEPLRSPAGKV